MADEQIDKEMSRALARLAAAQSQESQRSHLEDEVEIFTPTALPRRRPADLRALPKDITAAQYLAHSRNLAIATLFATTGGIDVDRGKIKGDKIIDAGEQEILRVFTRRLPEYELIDQWIGVLPELYGIRDTHDLTTREVIAGEIKRYAPQFFTFDVEEENGYFDRLCLQILTHMQGHEAPQDKPIFSRQGALALTVAGWYHLQSTPNTRAMSNALSQALKLKEIPQVPNSTSVGLRDGDYRYRRLLDASDKTHWGIAHKLAMEVYRDNKLEPIEAAIVTAFLDSSFNFWYDGGEAQRPPRMQDPTHHPWSYVNSYMAYLRLEADYVENAMLTLEKVVNKGELHTDHKGHIVIGPHFNQQTRKLRETYDEYFRNYRRDRIKRITGQGGREVSDTPALFQAAAHKTNLAREIVDALGDARVATHDRAYQNSVRLADFCLRYIVGMQDEVARHFVDP